jgi:GWxTD domain-containing protein
MRLLESWVGTPLAEAFGWTLLHSLWEGAVIAAALAVALALTRSPRVRYAAACGAMLAMVAAFGLTLVRVIPEVAGHPLTMKNPAVHATALRPEGDAVNRSSTELAAVVPWLAPFWLAGVCGFSLWHAAGCVSVRRLRRRGVCCAPDQWQEQLVGLSARLRISRPIRLMESCLVDTPVVMAHFRPFILMPVGLLARLPAEQIEVILLHELAHIRRCDYLVNVLQRSVESLLFYHPAVWWISWVMRAEREDCCDDVVVAMNGNAHEYAAALAALEQSRCAGREPALAATGGSLVKRIRRLLYPKAQHNKWAPLWAAALLMATIAVTLAAWPSAAAPGSASPQVAADTTPYAKWLNQEVVYIIAEDERATFESLASDEERAKFIEQFWLRRDPTPQNTPNEFKDEHYRRINYCNDLFRTTTGRAGWQTDRGRIYIVYGPPDVIVAHPSGAPHTPYPFQIWTYNHVEGIGDNLSITFRDRTGKGDYHVAPGSAQ